MAEVLSLVDLEIPQVTDKYYKFDTFKHLICHLFKKTSTETDSNVPIVIIFPTNNDIPSRKTRSTTTTTTTTTTNTSKLDNLPFSDKSLLIQFFFTHLNILMIQGENSDEGKLYQEISSAKELSTNRISRVGNWTGTTHFRYCRHENDCGLLNQHSKIAGIIPTMTYILNCNATRSEIATNQLIYLYRLMIEEINFIELLQDASTTRLSQLCYAVGHWSFPAHNLSNDDLVYCVYLMIDYAIKQVEGFDNIPLNELLAFIFIVRDTYKNGNPFHNFRHAVDVLQACFHFLIRLGSLPKFKQFVEDPKLDYTEVHDKHTVLIALQNNSSEEKASLNPIQTLGLLVAALGHDVGHPGTTNDFMIKFSAPTALLYNDRSVLESYHASLFINKVLRICWPDLLTCTIEEKSELTIRSLIISSILATDMGEHNEYVNRLKSFKTHNEILNHDNTVKLISALLIKCADISNVTRPLRVSAQWAMVLSREFAEVELLKSVIKKDIDLDFTKDLTYDDVPHELREILEIQPDIHKGQIFFINLFAENLFNSVSDLLPQLQYTCDIIMENKLFWLERAKK